jgi:hypothetical protein
MATGTPISPMPVPTQPQASPARLGFFLQSAFASSEQSPFYFGPSPVAGARVAAQGE